MLWRPGDALRWTFLDRDKALKTDLLVAPRQSYVLHLNDLYTAAAKIPLFVPQDFGG
jgi:hypothetical protein